MIALDVSLLVRYLAQDDATESPLATAVIEQQLSAANPGFVSCLALAQLHGVLTQHYSVDRAHFADIARGLLSAQALRFDNVQAAWNALQAHEDGQDFGAALIAELAAAAGCDATLTFDRQFARHPKARLPAPAPA